MSRFDGFTDEERAVLRDSLLGYHPVDWCGDVEGHNEKVQGGGNCEACRFASQRYDERIRLKKSLLAGLQEACDSMGEDEK